MIQGHMLIYEEGMYTYKISRSGGVTSTAALVPTALKMAVRHFVHECYRGADDGVIVIGDYHWPLPVGGHHWRGSSDIACLDSPTLRKKKSMES
jgi:hypothetical protein